MAYRRERLVVVSNRFTCIFGLFFNIRLRHLRFFTGHNGHRPSCEAGGGTVIDLFHVCRPNFCQLREYPVATSAMYTGAAIKLLLLDAHSSCVNGSDVIAIISLWHTEKANGPVVLTPFI